MRPDALRGTSADSLRSPSRALAFPANKKIRNKLYPVNNTLDKASETVLLFILIRLLIRESLPRFTGYGKAVSMFQIGFSMNSIAIIKAC